MDRVLCKLKYPPQDNFEMLNINEICWIKGKRSLNFKSLILKHQSPMAGNLLQFNSNDSVLSTGLRYNWSDAEYNDWIIWFN
jgi:hypothetical protein